VAAFRPDGAPVLRVGGLPGPRHLALDLYAGEAWVVCNGGELWRIAADGSVVLRRTGLSAPADIALDAGP
jgi:hypothetical protein